MSNMNEKLHELASLGALANATLELDKLLVVGTEAVSKLVDASAGSVLLLDNNELVFIVAFGEKERELKQMRIPATEGIAGVVIKTRKSYICNNTEKDPNFTGRTDSKVNFRTKNLVAVPLIFEGEILGVLEAVNKRSGDFTEEDAKILSAFGKLSAVAIRNARVFNTLSRAYDAEINEDEIEYALIGVSPAIEKIRSLISKIATAPSTVLITGESGVGKEVVARQIHLRSNRSRGPFIKVSCPSFPETLLESELFGHEKGAFTGADKRRIGRFELACGGTIFLDEIGDMPMTLQAKLLRVLQENVFERLGSNEPIRCDARVICATNKNLSEEIEKGKFRQDLFFRLNVVPINIPPLRERTEDIPFLVEHFLKLLLTKIPHQIRSVSTEAMEIMMSYRWPGNVRELWNTIERIAVVWSPQVILPEHLPQEILGAQKSRPIETSPGESTLPEIEKKVIEQVLAETNGNQIKAAKILGITRDKLRYRIEKYKIDISVYKHRKILS